MDDVHGYETPWDAYCAVEQEMFEAAFRFLSRFTPDQIRTIHDEADECGSDVAIAAAMMLGKKDTPEGWAIQRPAAEDT